MKITLPEYAKRHQYHNHGDRTMLSAPYEAFRATTNREHACTFAFRREAYDIASMMNYRYTPKNWHVHDNVNGTMEVRGTDRHGRTMYASCLPG